MYVICKSQIMESRTTSNIRVSVQPVYDYKNSYPSENRFVFRYNIYIENLGNIPVQLLRRKWLIYDVGYGFTEVAGDGVIGLTPEIIPDGDFSYFSNVILRSGFGNMTGTYTFRNLISKEIFDVEIPKFELHSQVLSN